MARDVVSAEVIYEVFSGLVSLSPGLDVVPDLATGWTTSRDATVYTFTLRSDATFHTGRPVSAADVVYSIQRACDPATASPVASTYLGDIVGCADRLAGHASSVAGVSSPDPDTVVITIDAAKAYFLAKLTYPTSFVVDREQVDSDSEWANRPVGSGPFRVERFARRDVLVLARHPAYHGGPAYLDFVELMLRPVATTTLYENGELDAVPIGAADLVRARDPLSPLSTELMEGPGDLSLTYLAFDTRRPPFNSVAARGAVASAIDRESIVRVVLGDLATPAEWILPPGMPGHVATAGAQPYSPPTARRLLAEPGAAGLRGGITISVGGEGGATSLAEAVADSVESVLGIPVTMVQTPWTVFQNEFGSGRHSAWLSGWAADYPDPQNFLDVLFHSAAPLNHSGFSDPELDVLLEAAREEPDHIRRLELYRLAEERVLDAVVWVPLFSTRDAWLVKSYVKGFSVPPMIVPRLGRVWLDSG